MGCKHSKVKNGNYDDPVDESKIDQDKIDQAILDLKVTRDKLKRYQKQQERCQEIELEKARELARSGKKERAKMVLRQKKAREYYINNAEKNISNLEVLINDVTTKQIEISVINNISRTNHILKELNSLMPVEEVERIMDENQEQQERLEEINSLLAQNMDVNPDMKHFVEDDLDRLYKELEAGEAEQENIPESESNKAEQYEIPDKVALAA